MVNRRRYDDFSNETDAKLITTPYPVVSIMSAVVGYQRLGWCLLMPYIPYHHDDSASAEFALENQTWNMVWVYMGLYGYGMVYIVIIYNNNID